MLGLMGLTWVEAPMEAEGAAAVMCSRGDVAAVASQDWDTLLYGAPVMVRNLTSHGTRRFGRAIHAERIVLSDMLEEHDITREQLVDVGIMVGTDFHPGIKGIGPKTGLKLIPGRGGAATGSGEGGGGGPAGLPPGGARLLREEARQGPRQALQSRPAKVGQPAVNLRLLIRVCRGRSRRRVDQGSESSSDR